MQRWHAIIIKVLTASTEGYDMNDSADRWRREQPPYLSTACAYTCVCVRVSTTESIQDIDRSNSLHPRHHARPKGSSHKRCHGLRTVHVHSQARANLTKPSVPPTHPPRSPPPSLQEVVRGNLDSAVDRGSRWLRLSSTTHLGRTTSLTLAF